MYKLNLLAFILSSLFQSQDSSSLPTQFSESDFVGVVQNIGTNPSNKRHSLSVIESYKGFTTFITISNELMTEGDNNYFLIFGSVNNNGNYIDKLLIQPILESEISPEIDNFLESLPCFIESEIINGKLLKYPTNEGACHRYLDPVCGCDGKFYGNPCEMRKAGIVRFTSGRCD